MAYRPTAPHLMITEKGRRNWEFPKGKRKEKKFNHGGKQHGRNQTNDSGRRKRDY